jgi:hypothetical protein
MKNKALFSTFFLIAFTATLYLSFLINLLIIVRVLAPGYITLGYFFVAVVTGAYILYAILAKPIKKLLKIKDAGNQEKPESKVRRIFSKMYTVVLLGWFISVIWASVMK